MILCLQHLDNYLPSSIFNRPSNKSLIVIVNNTIVNFISVINIRVK